MREDEVTDGRIVVKTEIRPCGQYAVRAGAGVDGDDSRARLDEREVADVVGLGDVRGGRRAERAWHA